MSLRALLIHVLTMQVPTMVEEAFLLGPNLASRLARDLTFKLAVVVCATIIVCCLVGPLIVPWEIAQVDVNAFAQPPSWRHPFGTDANGRDLLARTLFGGKISLLVGLLATFVSAVVGVAWGAVAGYVGGRVDSVMMRVVDILFALPFMFLVIVLVVVFGRHFILFFAAIGAVEWLTMARIIRGQTLSLRNREFVRAAQLMGLSSGRILWSHIFPNLRPIVIVYTTLTVPNVMLTESFISFLGLGIQEPMTSWGVLLRQGAVNMLSAPLQLFFPALFLVSTVLWLNIIGDRLQKAYEVGGRL